MTIGSKRILWVFAFLLLTSLLWGAFNCYVMFRMNQTFHLRGEFDRKNMIVRECGSTKSYDLVFTSGEYDHLSKVEKNLGIDDSEPVILEFEAEPIPSPWSLISRRQTTGIECCELVVERGSCTH